MSRSSRRCLRRRQAHYAQKMGDLLCFGNLTDFFPIRIDFGWYGMWLMTGTVSSSFSVLSVIISNGSNVSPNFGFFGGSSFEQNLETFSVSVKNYDDIKIFELFPSLDFGYTVTSSLFTMYVVVLQKNDTINQLLNQNIMSVNWYI